MSEDPIKRLAWLRADCGALRVLHDRLTSDCVLSRASLLRQIEDHEREIAELERTLDPSMVAALSATTAVDALAALVGAP